MRAVSMAEVAAKAGTSPSAVSRALNGRPGVRPDVRAAVLRAASELGYSAHPAARNLALGRTGLIGLVIADRDVVVGTTFFSELVAAIVTELDDADYQTVLLLPPARGPIDAKLRLERFDAAIVIGHRDNDPTLRHALARRVPTVTLGRPSEARLPYVDVDNVDAARVATEHLLGLGRRRVGLLAGPQDTTWGRDRLAGYQEAHRAHGAGPDPAVIEMCAFSHEGGREGTLALLDRCPDVDGLLVCSESLLAGTLAALGSLGRRIPADIAVVGFDDGTATRSATPPLSGVRQPLQAIGRELGRLAVESVAGDLGYRAVTMSAELQVRASTASSSSRTTAPGTPGPVSPRPAAPNPAG